IRITDIARVKLFSSFIHTSAKSDRPDCAAVDYIFRPGDGRSLCLKRGTPRVRRPPPVYSAVVRESCLAYPSVFGAPSRNRFVFVCHALDHSCGSIGFNETPDGGIAFDVTTDDSCPIETSVHPHPYSRDRDKCARMIFGHREI